MRRGWGVAGSALRRGWRIVAAVVAALAVSPFHGAATAQDHEWSEIAPRAAHALLLDAEVVAAARDHPEAGAPKIVVAGDRGHVLVSEDRGTTWVQARVPTLNMLTAIEIVDDRHMWAVGHDALIIYSSDGGLTWRTQYVDEAAESPLFDAWFEDATHGLAVGAYGLALETFDGGENWTPTPIGTEDAHLEDAHLYAIAESPQGMLYIAGEFGFIARSADRGATWEALESPYEGTFFGALALSDETVLVYGLRGNVFRSTDGGGAWERVRTETEAGILGGNRLASGRLVLVGLGGAILTSDDGGRSFEVTTRDDRMGMATVVPTGGDRFLVVGEDGVRADTEVWKP